MFGFGGQELLLVLLIVLFFFGPKQLPELARSFGEGMREFRKAQADFEEELNESIDAADPAQQAAIEPNPAAAQDDQPEPRSRSAS